MLGGRKVTVTRPRARHLDGSGEVANGVGHRFFRPLTPSSLMSSRRSAFACKSYNAPMRRVTLVVACALCAIVGGTALAARSDDRDDGADHFVIEQRGETIKGQIYAWATRDGSSKATSVASLSINPSASSELKVRVSEQGVIKVKSGGIARTKYTRWQTGKIALRAGSYGQSAPAFTFDIGNTKGWTLCGIKVKASHLPGAVLAGSTQIANFQMNFSRLC